jgi:hypothetical protein
MNPQEVNGVSQGLESTAGEGFFSFFKLNIIALFIRDIAFCPEETHATLY